MGAMEFTEVESRSVESGVEKIDRKFDEIEERFPRG